MKKACDAVIIGAAIADILLRPVDEEVFRKGSCAVESIRMSVGGDALNESTILARLGHCPLLVTSLGTDGVADFILSHCGREGVEVHAARNPQMDTGINAVLVTPDGERSFVTNKNGSLRRLSLQDVLPAFETDAFRQARLVCLASMFVSPQMNADDMEALFARAKGEGKIVCADTTKRKKGETVADVKGALSQLDYFFPNLDEAKLLTGLENPDEIADAFLDAGVSNVVLKLGGKGCLVKNAKQRYCVPAYPDAVCVDTTGAGDSFAAAFISAILDGESLLRCAAYANAVASVCIENLGSTTARFDQEIIRARRERILNMC